MAPEGLIGAAKSIDSAIQKNINGLNAAAKAAKDAINSSKTAANTATNQMAAQLKALSIQMAQLNTLSKALQSTGAGGVRAAGVLGDFSNTQALGKRIRQLTDYRQSLEGTASSVTTLRNRVAQFDQAAGNLAQQGKLLSQGQIFKAERLQATAQAYSKISNEANGLRSRIALLGEDGQKAFRPMLKSLEELDKANAKAFANRSRSNYQPEITATQKLVQNIREQLAVREKLEAKTRLNIQALRAEGDQIIKNTKLEREAALARQVRAGTTQLRNMAMTGGTLNQRDVDLVSRFSRATALAATTQNQLTAALNQPNTSAERIKTLIDRYKELQRQLGLTIAQQNQLNRGPDKSGGFLGGLKSSASNLLGGDTDGGFGFGAGALVGRVGAYAVAAGAIYGMITATKQAITFTVQFEDQLAQLQAISGSTSLEMERLSAGILEVGKNSSRSISELTNAATIIAQAGYAGNEIGLLLDNVTKLADASGSTADQSVDILTSALGAFQLEASESTRVTDGLVAALNDSKLAVNQVQLGLQYLGAIAKENNLTFEELTAVMGAAADAGIRSGSTAATGTRQLLIDLMDPSEKLVAQLTKIGLTTADIDVKTLGLVEVLNRLRDAGFQAYGTIETRAAAMYGVLANNTDQIERLVEAQTRQGAADQAQEIRLDSLSAKWQMLLNSLAETASIIGSILIPVLKLITDALRVFTDLINLALGLIGDLINEIVTLGGLLGDNANNAQTFNEALLETGLTAQEADAAMEQLGSSIDDVETAAKDAEAQMTSLEEKERTLQAETAKLMLRKEDLAGSTAEVSHQVNLLAGRFPGLRAEFAKTAGGIDGLIQAMIALEDQSKRTLIAQARVVQATQKLRQGEANEEAVGVRKLVASRVPFARANMALPPKQLADVQQYNKLIQRGNYNAALDLYNSLPSNHYLKKDTTLRGTATDIANFRYKYEDSTAQITNAENTIQAGNFMLTPEGKRVAQATRVATANAARASSQGTADGKSKETIKSNINASLAELNSLTQKYAGNDAILGVLGQAMSSQRAALNQLTPIPEKDKKSGGRSGRSAADRAKRDFQRNEAAIAKEEVDYQKELYENQVRALENAPTLEDLPDLLGNVDEALTKWLNADAEHAVQAILANNPTEAQKKKMLDAAGRKAEQLRLENIEKISDVLTRAIKKFIDETSKSIELQYQEAIRFSKRNVDLANARRRGLDNPIGSNDRPEYMKTILQRDADLAQDRFGRAQIPANERRIGQYQDLRMKAVEVQSDLERMLGLLGKKQQEVAGTADEIVVTAQMNEVKGKLHDVGLEIIDLDTKTRDLKDANEELKASFDVLNSTPTNFADGARAAVQAVMIETNAASSLGQELINNLDGPVRALRDGFKGFFSDMLSGTVTVGQAFKNFAGSVIQSIEDMAAAALANQIFQLIGQAVGAAIGGGVGGTQDAANSGLGQIYWRGGEVKSYAGGGRIRGGLRTRDSTLIHAAQGEHVIRNKAVESVGSDFLDSVNARGAEALRDIAPNVMVAPQAPPVETNVYVIAPEEKPQLGPNDVVAIITNDVLKGGATKQLIKKVANG